MIGRGRRKERDGKDRVGKGAQGKMREGKGGKERKGRKGGNVSLPNVNKRLTPLSGVQPAIRRSYIIKRHKLSWFGHVYRYEPSPKISTVQGTA